MKLQFVRLFARATDPLLGSAHAAGIDLCSIEHLWLEPQKREVAGTGIAVAIPDGYAGLIVSRSGLAARDGLVILNSPGIIDSDYRGELKLILYNSDNEVPFEVKIGARLAQLVIVKVPDLIELEEVTQLPETERGSNGLGSTGV